MDTEYTKGFRAGQEFENERIIKLLEATSENWRCCEGCCEWYNTPESEEISNQVTVVIALIKGEK